MLTAPLIEPTYRDLAVNRIACLQDGRLSLMALEQFFEKLVKIKTGEFVPGVISSTSQASSVLRLWAKSQPLRRLGQ